MQFIILFGNRKYKVSDMEESNQLLDGSVIFNLCNCDYAHLMHPKNNRECNEVKSRSEMMLRNEVLISSGAYL